MSLINKKVETRPDYSANRGQLPIVEVLKKRLLIKNHPWLSRFNKAKFSYSNKIMKTTQDLI